MPMFEGLMHRLCTNINNIYCYYFLITYVFLRSTTASTRFSEVNCY